MKMSSSNKNSNNNAIAPDSKTNQKQKNGIEPFVKKLSNIVSNTKCESGVRKNLRNDGNVKVNKNETNTLPRPLYSLEDLQSHKNHVKLLKSSVNNAQMPISQEVYTDYILKLTENISTFPPIAVNSYTKTDTPLPPQTSSGENEEDLSSSDNHSTFSSMEINVSKNITSLREVTIEETLTQQSPLPLSTEGSLSWSERLEQATELMNTLLEAYPEYKDHPEIRAHYAFMATHLDKLNTPPQTFTPLPLPADGSGGLTGTNMEGKECLSKQSFLADGPPVVQTEPVYQRVEVELLSQEDQAGLLFPAAIKASWSSSPNPNFYQITNVSKCKYTDTNTCMYTPCYQHNLDTQLCDNLYDDTNTFTHLKHTLINKYHPTISVNREGSGSDSSPPTLSDQDTAPTTLSGGRLDNEDWMGEKGGMKPGDPFVLGPSPDDMTPVSPLQSSGSRNRPDFNNNTKEY